MIVYLAIVLVVVLLIWGLMWRSVRQIFGSYHIARIVTPTSVVPVPDFAKVQTFNVEPDGYFGIRISSEDMPAAYNSGTLSIWSSSVDLTEPATGPKPKWGPGVNRAQMQRAAYGFDIVTMDTRGQLLSRISFEKGILAAAATMVTPAAVSVIPGAAATMAGKYRMIRMDRGGPNGVVLTDSRPPNPRQTLTVTQVDPPGTILAKDETVSSTGELKLSYSSQFRGIASWKMPVNREDPVTGAIEINPKGQYTMEYTPGVSGAPPIISIGIDLPGGQIDQRLYYSKI